MNKLDMMLDDAKIAASQGVYIARYIPELVDMVKTRDAEIQRITHWREKGRKWGWLDDR